MSKDAIGCLLLLGWVVFGLVGYLYWRVKDADKDPITLGDAVNIFFIAAFTGVFGFLAGWAIYCEVHGKKAVIYKRKTKRRHHETSTD
mgnify:CR=1 FL=1